MAIENPTVPEIGSQRTLDCQEALEEDFQGLVERAEDAGWATHEILAAIRDLAISTAIACGENDRTTDAIADAIRRCRSH